MLVKIRISQLIWKLSDIQRVTEQFVFSLSLTVRRSFLYMYSRRSCSWKLKQSNCLHKELHQLSISHSPPFKIPPRAPSYLQERNPLVRDRQHAAVKSRHFTSTKHPGVSRKVRVCVTCPHKIIHHHETCKKHQLIHLVLCRFTTTCY